MRVVRRLTALETWPWRAGGATAAVPPAAAPPDGPRAWLGPPAVLGLNRAALEALGGEEVTLAYDPALRAIRLAGGGRRPGVPRRVTRRGTAAGTVALAAFLRDEGLAPPPARHYCLRPVDEGVLLLCLDEPDGGEGR